MRSFRPFPCFLAGVSLFAIFIDDLPAPPKGFNYDESKVPEYTLPDPLEMNDGGKVSSVSDWPARRAEILELFAEQVYGRTPGAAVEAKFTVEPGRFHSDFLDGKATLKEVGLKFGKGDDAPVIHLMLVLPNAAKQPVPAFIGLNFRGNHTLHPDPRITLARTLQALTPTNSRSFTRSDDRLFVKNGHDRVGAVDAVALRIPDLA